jgi:hypothetical protein
MKVAISQSNYIPWKGYFDQIKRVDVFVVYDCAQYTRRDWRNRNKIMTSNGPHWLTIPVLTKGEFLTSVEQIEVEDSKWIAKHLGAIRANYAKTPFFKELFPKIEAQYKQLEEEKLLSRINVTLLKFFMSTLGINTKIMLSSEFELVEGKSERLLGICLNLNATTYLSGPAAKDYLDVELFQAKGINVEWMEYSHYRPYPQTGPEFTHYVSIIDLLMNTGPQAVNYFN